MSLEHVCKNCGKKIPRTLTFCSENCKEEYKSKTSKTKKSTSYKIERNTVKEMIGHEVKLTLSRGSYIRGKVIDFDDEFGKITIENTDSKGKYKEVVRLGYVIAFRIYE